MTLAINRYQGNSGIVRRIAEQSDTPGTSSRPTAMPAAPTQKGNYQVQSARPPGSPNMGNRGGGDILSSLGGSVGKSLGGLTGGIEKSLSGIGEGIEKGLGGIFSKLSNLELETEDLILLLILYLMYRESKDEQILIIMAIMLFL